ncbi:DUF460 domain-containing protein [Candidatus Woesearchaeota archaeon]|nr:DUF460 domain-containing protein [Candidatus Woesearchaeota archaeon]
MTGSRKQLIVGIDPGTTSAYALLSIDGEAIKVKSSKKLNLSQMIKETTKHGTPLIVGTDRRKCPELVSKYAAKTGAKKAVPSYDLPEAEKNAIAKGFQTENSHQKDALAAAYVAYKQYEALLKRIDKTLLREGKTDYSDEVKSIVISRKISIKKAVDMIEERLPLIRSD